MKTLTSLLVVGLTLSTFSVPDTFANETGAATQGSSESSEAQTPELQSENEDQDKSPTRVRRTQTLREVVYEKLEEARNFADEGQFDQAMESLQRLEKRKRNSYERAMTHNMVAYVYSAQEDYANAILAYNDVIAIKNAPDSLKQTTLFTLAKLHMIEENFDQSLVTLNEWMAATDKVKADAYVLRAQVQYQRQQYEAARDDIATAISLRQEHGKSVAENWYLLQRAALFQLKDYPALATNLEALVAHYSKSDYWVQLAAVYNELGRADEELATLETAYDQGLLKKESELLNFAQALLGKEIPVKAASVLQQGLDADIIEASARNLSLLGDAWMMAKEYDQAIVSMTAAADASGKGSDYFKLAQIYTERQDWQQALTFSNRALQAGDLKAPYQAMIVKGLAQYNLDALEDASATFFAASRYPQAEKVAHQWQEYIESEQSRREYIASSGLY